MLEEKEFIKRILGRGNIPKHIAIIMDGNGRWAKKRNLGRLQGHAEGVKSVRAVIEACDDIGVKVATFYTFSTENWKRPKGEVLGIWQLLIKTIREEMPDLKKNNIRLIVSGMLEDLPILSRESVLFAIRTLKNNTGLIMNLALNYSSRSEIVYAVKKIVKKVVDGHLKPDDIDEETISQHLFTSSLPDPDLVIRTSGELRMSNFLLWQIAYSEFYITPVLWPEFRKIQFFEAIEAYQLRERRFGKVSEQVNLIN